MAAASRSAELRVWAPQGAQVLFVRQVAPTVEDLTSRRTPVNPLTGGVPDRLVGRRVPRLPRRGPAGGQGDRRRSSSPRGSSSSLGDEVRGAGPGQGDVVRRRRPDRRGSTRGRALHRTDRAGAGDPGRPGRQGRRRRRRPRPRSWAGPSSSPRETGNEEVTSRLRKVVDIDDAGTGTVRLKRSVEQGSTRWRSTRPPPRPPGCRSDASTVRTGTRPRATTTATPAGCRSTPRQPAAAGAGARCRGADPAATPAPAPAADVPQLPEPASADALFCETCGYDFTTGTMPRAASAAGPSSTSAAAGGTAGPTARGSRSSGSPRSGSTPTGTPCRRATTRARRPACRPWSR